MTQMKKVLLELDKGDYDNFKAPELILELMRDFKISHTLSHYIVIAFFHYKGK